MMQMRIDKNKDNRDYWREEENGNEWKEVN